MFSQQPKQNDSHPRIINIINFIRQNEPRDSAITEDVLYQTVVKQIEMMKQYKLGGTFLLQYDALIDPRYQQLLKSLPANEFEIGGWWEIPQPLVEHAGLRWRGKSPWDPDASVDFSPGYSLEERKKLIDVYMKDFKSIFGYYPKSFGSWFIDAFTIGYMYKKYGIVASCNCKDQIGTDGYTLWGGYWNQAYYPSVENSYMPAQHESKQIPVPIFRMLGSDPIRQYDNGLGTDRQGVVTLEPVYKFGGGDENWVKWYFDQFVNGACMDFAYVQAGQENSFTWNAMQKGFEIQLPVIAKLRDEGKVKVETLERSGEWFREHFKTTPPTAVTVNEDLKGSDRKTVWFNSRFFRTNILWENNTLRFRDIHLFNENFASIYTTEKSSSRSCSVLTLPFVDGYMWSAHDTIAGLRFKAMVNGKEILIEGGKPVISDSIPNELNISWQLNSFNGKLLMNINEREIKIRLVSKKSVKWFFDMTTAENAHLPFTNISSNKISCAFEKMNYTVVAKKGKFSKPANGEVFRISPDENVIMLDFGE
ncbi:MAG: hypothetical protein JST87_06700 [Bacteroidetes bacterium]|nr:hypothetical protein [Bacteroidota bacterium]